MDQPPDAIRGIHRHPSYVMRRRRQGPALVSAFGALGAVQVVLQLCLNSHKSISLAIDGN